jgi:hypothetical protein
MGTEEMKASWYWRCSGAFRTLWRTYKTEYQSRILPNDICHPDSTYINDMLALIPLFVIWASTLRHLRDRDAVDIACRPSHINRFLRDGLRASTGAVDYEHPLGRCSLQLFKVGKWGLFAKDSQALFSILWLGNIVALCLPLFRGRIAWKGSIEWTVSTMLGCCVHPPQVSWVG